MAPPRGAALVSLAAGAAAHGRMTLPTSRQGGTLAVAGTTCGNHQDGSSADCECCWYTNDIAIPGPPTICDQDLVTVKLGAPCGPKGSDWTYNRPWRAPGSAPILSPCGVSNGKDGVDLPPTRLTQWTRGAAVEVAMAATANHGGGYAYRLCPAADKPTEACFQKHHLRFADDTTTIRFVNGDADISIPARRTTNGTTPAGSQWTRNPIPRQTKDFAPPFPGGEGTSWPFSLIDRVVLPADLVPGQYVVSWRWDCEIQPQSWSNCGDVYISDHAPPRTPAPAPRPPTPLPPPQPAPTSAPVPEGCSAAALCPGEAGQGAECQTCILANEKALKGSGCWHGGHSKRDAFATQWCYY